MVEEERVEAALKTKFTIVKDYPPNFGVILQVFPNSKKPGVIFTYGDKVYNPSNVSMSPALLAHEAVHVRQQSRDGETPEAWWLLYLNSPEFRYEQELEAHRVELAVYKKTNNRHFSRKYAKDIAVRLAGPLYGNGIKTKEAHNAITA